MKLQWWISLKSYFFPWIGTGNEEVLDQIELPILADTNCSVYLPQTELCAGYTNGGKDFGAVSISFIMKNSTILKYFIKSDYQVLEINALGIFTLQRGKLGVHEYTFFLFLLKSIDGGYSLEQPYQNSPNQQKTIYIWSNNKENIINYLLIQAISSSSIYLQPSTSSTSAKDVFRSVAGTLFFCRCSYAYFDCLQLHIYVSLLELGLVVFLWPPYVPTAEMLAVVEVLDV